MEIEALWEKFVKNWSSALKNKKAKVSQCDTRLKKCQIAMSNQLTLWKTHFFWNQYKNSPKTSLIFRWFEFWKLQVFKMNNFVRGKYEKIPNRKSFVFDSPLSFVFQGRAPVFYELFPESFYLHFEQFFLGFSRMYRSMVWRTAPERK